MWGEAASKIAEVVNDELFRSLEGKSKHALWLELCDIVTRHPREVEHLKVEAIIRAGIRKFTDEVRTLGACGPMDATRASARTGTQRKPHPCHCVHPPSLQQGASRQALCCSELLFSAMGLVVDFLALP